MSTHLPGDSRYRQRLEMTQDPRWLHLKQQLATVRRERTNWKMEASRQRARAELWRMRALRGRR